MAKRYYWLKLMNDFFTQPKIKKLRKIAGGDTYTIIYLKMQLLSLKNGGRLFFEGIESEFAEEIALTIDEDPENVKVTVQYLLAQGLMETSSDDEYLMIETQYLIGSECDSAIRVRKHRSEKTLQSNAGVTKCNAIETKCNTDIDIDKDIDKDIYNTHKCAKNAKRIKKEYSVSFEVFWSEYPLKKEKARAYKCYLSRLKDGYSEEQLLSACKNYADECRRRNTETRYIKHGSTFLSSDTPFIDYFNCNYNPDESNSVKVKDNNNFERRKYDMESLERDLIGK